MSVTTEQAITPLDALRRIDTALDLSGVRMKLGDSEEGKGHPTAQIQVMEREYRRFLALHLAYPDLDIVPCRLVDEIWHQHILDTIAYRADCDAIFGQFLDHFPYFGMRGADDAKALNDAYADTLELYESAFGDIPANTWVSGDASSCKRTACKPQKCR